MMTIELLQLPSLAGSETYTFTGRSRLMGNWIKFCNMTYIQGCNKRVKFHLKIHSRLGNVFRKPQGEVKCFDAHCACVSTFLAFIPCISTSAHIDMVRSYYNTSLANQTAAGFVAADRQQKGTVQLNMVARADASDIALWDSFWLTIRQSCRSWLSSIYKCQWPPPWVIVVSGGDVMAGQCWPCVCTCCVVSLSSQVPVRSCLVVPVSSRLAVGAAMSRLVLLLLLPLLVCNVGVIGAATSSSKMMCSCKPIAIKSSSKQVCVCDPKKSGGRRGRKHRGSWWDGFLWH